MKSKIFIYVAIFLIIISGTVFAAGQGVPVQVTEPKVKTFEQSRVLNGVVEPLENILVSAQLGGVIEDVLVGVGQRVKKDQILIAFDQDQVEIQIKQAEAALDLAKANLDLVLKGVSEEDKRLAETSYDQAQISYDSAKQNLKFAQEMFSDRTMQKQQLLGAKTQLESAEVQLKLAEERYTQAELGYEVAKEDYTRMSYLHDNGVITQKQFEGVEAQYKNAESTLASAELGKKQAQVSYNGALESYQLAEEMFENRLSAEQQVSAAMTQLKLAEASLQIAQANLDKINKGVSAEQVKISKASVKQAEAALELAKMQLDNSVIKSPIEGIIAQVNVDAGEMAGPGTPVVLIIDIDQVYLKLDVTADMLDSIKVGQLVKTQVLALYNEVFQGKISTISPMVDARSQGYPVKILLDNIENRIKPGMFADATLVMKLSKGAVVVPIEAVLNLDSSPYLYVAVQSANGQWIAEKRDVKTGLINRKEIEIVQGLFAGEKVVVMGQFSIKDGEVLEVTER